MDLVRLEQVHQQQVKRVDDLYVPGNTMEYDLNILFLRVSFS